MQNHLLKTANMDLFHWNSHRSRLRTWIKSLIRTSPKHRSFKHKSIHQIFSFLDYKPPRQNSFLKKMSSTKIQCRHNLQAWQLKIEIIWANLSNLSCLRKERCVLPPCFFPNILSLLCNDTRVQISHPSDVVQRSSVVKPWFCLCGRFKFQGICRRNCKDVGWSPSNATVTSGGTVQSL